MMIGIRQRGVALIEALVALLVMAFGMVAVAGLISTMRFSADVAKQRGEGLRIAQQQMETLRDYSLLSPVSPADYALRRDYGQMIPASATPGSTQVSDLGLVPGSNTTFQATLSVTDLVDPPAKAVNMTVSWNDRSGGTQSVITDSFITRADPTLSAGLGIAPAYTATERPPNGASALPPAAKNLGDGRSVLIRQSGSNPATAFVFNNISGVITSRCTVPAGTTTAQINTSADLTSCVDTFDFALWGYVNFAGASPLTPTNLGSSIASTYALPLSMSMAAIPSATAPPALMCFDDGPFDASDPRTMTQTTVSYLCVVTPVAVDVQTTIGPTGTTTVYTWASGSYTKSAATPTATKSATTGSATTAWFGRLNVDRIIPASGTSTWQICRYSGDYNGDGVISNGEHPLNYRVVEGALGNQNFLVVKSTASCPTGADGTSGSAFFQTATVAHQPNGVETAAITH